MSIYAAVHALLGGEHRHVQRDTATRAIIDGGPPTWVLRPVQHHQQVGFELVRKLGDHFRQGRTAAFLFPVQDDLYILLWRADGIQGAEDGFYWRFVVARG